MATKRSDVKDLVNSDMAARNLPTKASEREEDSDELVARHS